MFQFDESQLKAIEGALNAIKIGRKFYKIGGYAGTGKSTIAIHIAQQSGLTFRGTCYMGKSASQLRIKGIKNSETLHRTMYDWDEASERFYKKKSIECDLLILDEGSTVPGDLWSDAQSFKAFIVVLGDPAQLEPINADDAKLMHTPDILLEKIHRYEGSIAYFANQVRMTGNIPRMNNEEVSVKSKNSFMIDLKKELPSVVLCGFNKTRVAVNVQVRLLKGFKKKINVGEQLIGLKNNREVGIFNGQMLDVLDVLAERQDRKFGIYTEARVQMDDGVIRMMKLWHGHLDVINPLDWRKLPEKLATVDYGYSTTVHKYQGSEAEDVMFIDEQATELWDATRHRYTTITRAQERLRVYID